MPDHLSNPYYNGYQPPRKLQFRISEEDFRYINSKFPSCVGLHDKLGSMLFRSLINELHRIDDEHLTHYGVQPDPAWCATDPEYSILAYTLNHLMAHGEYRRGSGPGWVRTTPGTDGHSNTTSLHQQASATAPIGSDLPSGASESGGEARGSEEDESQGLDSGRAESTRTMNPKLLAAMQWLKDNT